MLTMKQIQSMGLVIVAFEDWPVIEAAANPDNEKAWQTWAGQELIKNNHGPGWLWEYEHPITRV